MKISVKELNQLLSAERERNDVLTLTLCNLRRELARKDCFIKDLEILIAILEDEQCDSLSK
jgi:hypothetical protein